ncbi:MAG: hypothetical protein EP348_03190, partial [Alphaproteobacteria bacterium]
MGGMVKKMMGIFPKMLGIFPKWKTKSVKAEAVTETAQTAKEVKFTKFGIGARLLAAFSVVTLLTILMAVVSWFSLGSLTKAEAELIATRIPSITLSLKLANETSQLTSSAAKLKASKTESERNQNYKIIRASISSVSQRLKNIQKIRGGNSKALDDMAKDLEGLSKNFARLNDEVKHRITLNKELGGAGPRLSVDKDILDTELGSLLLPLRMEMIQNADNWNELLDKSVKEARDGSSPSYDTDELSGKGLDLLRFQESVFSFKSKGYLMISLLIQC